MSNKVAISSLCTGIMALILASDMAEAAARKANAGIFGCTRQTVLFSSLAPPLYGFGGSELDRVYHCTVPAIACAGAFVTQFQIKRIAADGSGQTIPQWLSPPSNLNTPYTQSSQDTIIAKARSVAQLNRPPSTFVFDIRFFWENAANYYIGADVTYAQCGPRIPIPN